jgi:hypothetical protein
LGSASGVVSPRSQGSGRCGPLRATSVSVGLGSTFGVGRPRTRRGGLFEPPGAASVSAGLGSALGAASPRSHRSGLFGPPCAAFASPHSHRTGLGHGRALLGRLVHDLGAGGRALPASGSSGLAPCALSYPACVPIPPSDSDEDLPPGSWDSDHGYGELLSVRAWSYPPPDPAAGRKARQVCFLCWLPVPGPFSRWQWRHPAADLGFSPDLCFLCGATSREGRFVEPAPPAGPPALTVSRAWS